MARDLPSAKISKGDPDFVTEPVELLITGLKSGKTLAEAVADTGQDSQKLLTQAAVQKRLAELGVFTPLANPDALEALANHRLAAILMFGEDRDANAAAKTVKARPDITAVQVNVLSPEVEALEVGDLPWGKKEDK